MAAKRFSSPALALRSSALRSFASLSLIAALALGQAGAALAQAADAAAPEQAAAAAPSGAVSIELNALQELQGGCRLVFVTQGPAGSDLTNFALETVLFNQAGQVAALTLLDFREVLAERMRVRSFDMAGRACGDIGRVLFNAVSACAPQEAAACAHAPVTSSRVDGVELLQ